MRYALLQRQNLTLKAIQVQQGRRRPKSVEIPFYPIEDCSVLTLLIIKNKRLFISAEGFSTLKKTAVIRSQRAMLPIQTHCKETIPKIQTKIIPEQDMHRVSPNFHIHVSVSDLYISRIGLPILLQENMWTDSGNI
jgi:hypothetical protein